MSEDVLEQIREEINQLPQIERKAAESYSASRSKLKKFVDEELANRDDIDELIGYNSREMMKDNHENHIQFMSNVFHFNEYRLLSDIVPWVYKTYRKKGFSYDYFPVELEAWKQAVKTILGAEKAGSIIKIYDWMKESHDDFITASQKLSMDDASLNDEWEEVFDKFLEALLLGEDRKAQQIAEDNIDAMDDFEEFARNIIKPTMYTIGIMWEQDDITTAEEHRATSIAARVLSSFYTEYLPGEYFRGKAVVSAVVNEHHELGARIIADFLEFNGWNVSFLGANTPREELIEFLQEEKPFLLGLSVGMPYNLKELKETIEAVRNEPDLQNIKILVGGKTLNDFPYLMENIDADARAEDGSSAVDIADRWWNKKNV